MSPSVMANFQMGNDMVIYYICLLVRRKWPGGHHGRQKRRLAIATGAAESSPEGLSSTPAAAHVLQRPVCRSCKALAELSSAPEVSIGAHSPELSDARVVHSVADTAFRGRVSNGYIL